MNEPIEYRITSRKFWALVCTLIGAAWAMRWLLSELIRLMEAAKIPPSVFENLAGVVITTGAMFCGAVIGSWFGANVWQKLGGE